MTDLELLAELIGDLARDLRPEIEPLTPEAVAWNPGPQANSIGVTLWHTARGMDFLAMRMRILQDGQKVCKPTCAPS